MNRRVRFAAALATLGAWLGCALTLGCAGYHLGPVSNAGYKSVAVPMFKNKTLKPQLEAQVTNGILKRLQADGTLRVEPAEVADVVLVGEIVRYRRDPLRSVREDANKPREYRISIEAQIEAHDRLTGKTVLKPTVVTGSAETFIGTDQQSAENQLLPLIADDLAKRVVTLLVERW